MNINDQIKELRILSELLLRNKQKQIKPALYAVIQQKQNTLTTAKNTDLH